MWYEGEELGLSRPQKWNLGVILGVLWYSPIFLGTSPTEIWPQTGLKFSYKVTTSTEGAIFGCSSLKLRLDFRLGLLEPKNMNLGSKLGLETI